MKSIYVSDLLSHPVNVEASLLCWLRSRRKKGGILFLDVVDSTGMIQVVFAREKVTNDIFELAQRVPLESSLEIRGDLVRHASKPKEIAAKSIVVISESTLQMSPQPRGTVDIFDPKLTNHLLANRHIYLRNPKIMAMLKFRSLMMSQVRKWFEANRFIEIDAPILTPVPLYDDGSAMPIEVHGEKVFLTQCVGYYLEAAAHAFERVYNMGPSFRGEESRSRRHLMEYHHIKAEIAFGDLEDIIRIVEDLIRHITHECWNVSGDILETLGTKMCLDGLNVPFARISYEDAVKQLQQKGFIIQFGEGLGSLEEEELSQQFSGPFWITGIPRVVEPFPYVIDSANPAITRVADLIASHGFGELLGVAEKIHDPAMLDERLQEKGKLNDARYEWIREVHRAGCVPHVAFGMGVERMIRWLLNVPHVRDAIPFPRIFRRKIYP